MTQYEFEFDPCFGRRTDHAQLFENHAKTIIGLERLMLEAAGFDFRNRYPHELLIKVVKLYSGDKMTLGKTAYNISLDLYRTYVPLKQTTSTMVIACVELSGRLLEQNIEEIELHQIDEKFCTTREEIMGISILLMYLCYGQN